MVFQWTMQFGTLCCVTLLCSTGCLLVLPFPTFVECGHGKGRMATSQDQSEFLVQQRFYPKTKGIQDDLQRRGCDYKFWP